VSASARLVVVGVILFGGGIGNAVSFPPSIAELAFARNDVPRVVAFIVAIARGLYAFAPTVSGVIQEFIALTIAAT
jgi:hypothetical protein